MNTKSGDLLVPAYDSHGTIPALAVLEIGFDCRTEWSSARSYLKINHHLKLFVKVSANLVIPPLV